MTAHALTDRVGRAARSLSRHGVRGTAARVHEWIVLPALQRIYLVQSHVWLGVPLNADPPPMLEGYALRRGDESDLPALAAIGGISPETGRRYLASGAELYVARQGDDLAFSAWIHPDRVPFVAAAGGMLELPATMVALEDSIAAPAHRRSGIAVHALDRITAIQHRNGMTDILTRVAEDNVAARRWLQKMGTKELAVTRLRKIGPWKRTKVETLPGGEQAAALLARQVGAS